MKKIRQVVLFFIVTFLVVGCMDDGQEDQLNDGEVTKDSLIGKWNSAGYTYEYYINGVLENSEKGDPEDGFSITFNSNNTYRVDDGEDYSSEGTFTFEEGKLVITYTVEEDLNGDGEIETYTYTDELEAYFEDGKLVFKYEDVYSNPGSSDEYKEIGYEFFVRAS